MSDENQEFALKMDPDVLNKFQDILSEGSMVHASSVGHQSNNLNNGFEDLTQD